jgi:nucleotide-binding universal stress UspA family protein
VLALAAGIRHPIDGVIRFIHIRIWDPPVRGDGKFYPETSQEAHAVVEDALIAALARDVEATGTVVEAQRSEVAAAILSESAVWGSDVIVLSQRRRRTLSLTPLCSVNRRVMRGATCPVLLTHQGRR